MNYNDGSGMNCNRENMLYCMLIFSGVFAIINVVSFLTTNDYFRLAIAVMNIAIFGFFSYELYRLKNGKQPILMREVIIDQNGNTVKVESKKEKKEAKRDVLKTKFRDFQKNNK